MKKSVSLLLAGLMLCGALAGCGGNNNTAENTDSQTEQTSESTGTSGAIDVYKRQAYKGRWAATIGGFNTDGPFGVMKSIIGK